MTGGVHEDPHTSMDTLVSSITVAAFVINVTNVLWLLWLLMLPVMQLCFSFVGYQACRYPCVYLICHYYKGYQSSLVAALM